MKLLLATSVAALSASVALAGGPVFVPAPLPPIPAPIVEAWSGPYVGVQAGLGNGTLALGPAGPDQVALESGPVYGLHAGYNFDLGSIVLGAEIDYNLADIVSEEIDGVVTVTALAHLKARVGYDLGSALVYGVGGMAYMETEWPGGFSGDLSDTGVFYGVGAEYMISSNWSAGVEYLYHDFEDFGSVGFTEYNVELHTIQARASYHF